MPMLSAVSVIFLNIGVSSSLRNSSLVGLYMMLMDLHRKDTHFCCINKMPLVKNCAIGGASAVFWRSSAMVMINNCIFASLEAVWLLKTLLP